VWLLGDFITQVLIAQQKRLAVDLSLHGGHFDIAEGIAQSVKAINRFESSAAPVRIPRHQVQFEKLCFEDKIKSRRG
jgi:hypothetical protein